MTLYFVLVITFKHFDHLTEDSMSTNNVMFRDSWVEKVSTIGLPVCSFNGAVSVTYAMNKMMINNGELGRKRKRLWPISRYCPQNLRRGAEKTYEKSHNGRYPCRDSKPGPHAYEVALLITTPLRYVEEILKHACIVYVRVRACARTAFTPLLCYPHHYNLA
jgi:hypothetical protein